MPVTLFASFRKCCHLLAGIVLSYLSNFIVKLEYYLKPPLNNYMTSTVSIALTWPAILIRFASSDSNDKQKKRCNQQKK